MTSHPYLGKRITVLGLGASGYSMARYLAAQGALLTVADTRPAPPQLAQLQRELPGVRFVSGEFNEALFDGCDLIAASPGVAIDTPLLLAVRLRHLPIVGDVELFARALPKGQKILAITGSNGKTTTTSLVGELCKAAGLHTVVCGNIGDTVLDQLPQSGEAWPDVYVIELSSFQIDTTHSLIPTAATVLNISEDHLDRYPSRLAYAASKARIFTALTRQVLNRDDPLVMLMEHIGKPAVTFSLASQADFSATPEHLWVGKEVLLATHELQLIGRHNHANVLAALALVAQIGISAKSLIPALKTFQGLAHRVERIATVKGVDYIDDSKGTNVGATEAAIKGLGKACVLIAGGDGKGQDFAPLREPIRQHARAVILIGRDGPAIAAVLTNLSLPIEFAQDLPAAVQRAAILAEAGDAVMLSPACASFDMFNNYLHRSEVFAAAVAQLAVTT
jgi:UDP-N-acetylmuramoylalanine--D-glutamate ligase